MRETRAVLVGQAPGSAGDPSKPLAEGAVGKRLVALAGLTTAEYLLSFDRTNLLVNWPGKCGKGDAFDKAEATRSASLMSYRLRGRTVVMLGRNVAEAFGFPEEKYFKWLPWFEGGKAAVMPHPSGIVQWWNDPKNVRAASLFMRGLL